MVLVIIILVAWAVILGPNLWKRRSRTVGGISSISHFHRQLRVLEHSSPEPLVAPAYRLRTVDGSDASAPGPDRPEVRALAPKLTVVWALSLVSGVALVAYVALLVRMRQMAEERERKLRYLPPPADALDGPDATDALADRAGRVSGRYAHPAYQAAAAH
jgi:hypothetical protein